MKFYQKIFIKFAKWLQPKHKIIHADELPENVKNKIIYIIGDSEQPWLLAFKCPCGCENLIQLNLLKEAEPCWKFTVYKGMKLIFHRLFGELLAVKATSLFTKARLTGLEVIDTSEGKLRNPKKY